MAPWSIFKPWSREGRNLEEVAGAYRCIRCGAAFERKYRECPECGGQFLAPLPDRDDVRV